MVRSPASWRSRSGDAWSGERRPRIGSVRPFLLLATRAEDQAADDEYAAFLRFAGLPPEQLHRIRLEAGPPPPLDPHDHACIFLCGGPCNSSAPPELKSPVQHRVEAELARLLDEVVA